jgi:hypothetical protein
MTRGKLSRREMLKITAQFGSIGLLPSLGEFTYGLENYPKEVNDAQSKLNLTYVHKILTPTSIGHFEQALREAKD